ncbi:single-stranded-DNA-specific exonuclease RecJ [Parvularcula sp. IMCC14364]|uniref:single-stranded-DNA-specific exonuclease RecJ n=1 Tax=Parvularcula sp. IMCC14364 TaxID=3067902 RepID=UPI0027410E78|nr:single-stranded-DNA-specific exonuclease RecJ [Parvularcula sp. IMCC14364]
METDARMVTSERDELPVLVERSLSGKSWLKRSTDQRAVETISQSLGVSHSLAEIISARGVSPEQAEAHLAPSIKSSMPDPLIMKDMQPAIDRLAKAIEDKEKIGVFGDYDVDGTTASALLSRYFRALDIDHEVYLPDRILEGYGPNLQAFRYLQEKSASLCLTVDCGAMAHEILEQVRQDGLDVVVLDHHQMTLPAPRVIATVNPNRPDDLSGLNNLSAVGVAFMVLVALNRQLREAGYFQSRAEPKIMHWLDLVALGLVCDVMPLNGLTRVLVAQGLKVFGQLDDDAVLPPYPGLKLLAQRAGAKGDARADHLGFSIGPRINAAGRIGHANLAFRLMTAREHGDAMNWTEKLQDLNEERKAIEAEVLAEAVAQIERGQVDPEKPYIIAAGDGWHPGVIGIVAGRLKEKYSCPAIVISLDGDTGKGSGRSVSGVDLGGIIAAAKREDILVSGGGHAMAAGLTVARDKLEAFKDYLLAHIVRPEGGYVSESSRLVDSVIAASAVTRSFADEVAGAGPYGQEYPEPVVMLKEMRVRYADIKGANHVAVTLEDKMGKTVRGIAFRSATEPKGRELLIVGNTIHVLGKVKADEWRGGEAGQIIIEDVARA